VRSSPRFSARRSPLHGCGVCARTPHPRWRLSGQSRRSENHPCAERQTSQAGPSGRRCQTACHIRNHRPIASWSAAAKIRTKVTVCIPESENQGGVSLSPMSNRPAPTQPRVWRSWFSLRRKPCRVSQHPVGHPRDRSGIAGTLRWAFILPCMTSSSPDSAPALCGRCQLGAARVSFGLRYRGSSAGARAWRVPSALRCGDGRSNA
jgi:hypothetical protein